MSAKNYKSPIIQGSSGSKGEPGGDNAAEELTIEEKVLQLELQIRMVQTNVTNQTNLLREELRVLQEAIENIRNGIHAVNESLSKQTKTSSYLERRVDGVRTDTSTGIALSIVVFSLLFIISLFIR